MQYWVLRFPTVGRNCYSTGFLWWEGTVTLPGSCGGKEPGSYGGKGLLLYWVLVMGRNCYSTGFLWWEGAVTLPGSCGGKELLFFIDEHISDGIGL